MTGQTERRQWPRFSLRVPVTVFVEDLALPAIARDVSDRGVYFHLRAAESEMIERDFDFLMKLPPEITFLSWCSIQGRGRVLRKDAGQEEVAGIAAEILHYSIVRESGSSVSPKPGDPPASS